MIDTDPEKVEPFVKKGRKVTGLAEKGKKAGLPKDEKTSEMRGFLFIQQEGERR